MTRYIDAFRASFGVEPICKTLQVAPSSYYAARRRPASAHRLRDETLKPLLRRVHAQHFGVYGVRKLWHQLQCEGTEVARCTVARLMRDLGLKGVRRGRRIRTTVTGKAEPRPADVVQRHFHPPQPNRLWVADLTYVRTRSGFAYAAFIAGVGGLVQQPQAVRSPGLRPAGGVRSVLVHYTPPGRCRDSNMRVSIKPGAIHGSQRPPLWTRHKRQ